MTVSDQQNDGVVTPLKGIRRTAARRMITAWEAPVFHLSADVDMSSALQVKEHVAGATVTDALLAACAQALVDNPSINAHYRDEAVTTFERVNLGMAVATDAGLVVPVIHGADRLGLSELAQARREMTLRARQTRLTLPDMQGGTFTISNLGMMGIDHFDAILNVPQVAILAVGATRQRQVWNDGEPAWRPLASVTLTCDHRAVDGAAGARFLSSIREHLERG